MKAVLGKFAFKKAVGLYVGEQQVTVCQVGSTPLGPVQLACQSERYGPEQLTEVVGRLLVPLLGRRKRRPPVALGMPALRVFFSTRPIRTSNTNASPHVLLHEVLQSPNVCIDDMAAEVIRAEPGKRKLASIVACRKKYLTGLVEGLEACNVRPFRAEPAPCALLRAAVRQRRPPRRAKVVVRIFLGEREGLAVVTTGALSVLWRSFRLPADGEPAAICSAVRAVSALTVHCGIDSAPDTVMIHGRADLCGALESEAFRQQLATPLICCDSPALDDAAVAYGLALGCLGQQPSEVFDLSRSLKPRLPLWAVVPWGEAAVQVAVVICIGLFLLKRSHTVEEALRPVQAEYAQRQWLTSVTEAQLQKEQKDLELRVNSINKFVASRIAWTAYTHDLSQRLPSSATLKMLQGTSELEQFGKSDHKPKKLLTLQATAPIAEDGSIPKEIDHFLASLDGDPLLKGDFPLVELADVKWYQPNSTARPTALFTVICLPKATLAAPKPAAEK